MNVKNTTSKSSIQQLANRGYIDYLHFDYNHYDVDTFLSMLQSKTAIERSIAARGLSSHVLKRKVVEALLEALAKEKALYTKIEITNSLKKGNKITLITMFKYLGKIGNNQYVMLPKQVSKKKTYPLPRDIIARTIGHMNPNLFPYLIDYLPSCPLIQARELIDAIGFMAYHSSNNNKKAYKVLMKYFEKSDDPVIRWKIVTCFSAFLPLSKEYLTYLSNEDDLLGKEANRSLSFLNK